MREKGQPSNLYKKKGCNQNKQVDMKRTQTGDRGRQKRSRYNLAKTQKNLLAEPARRREAASDCFFFRFFCFCSAFFRNTLPLGGFLFGKHCAGGAVLVHSSWWRVCLRSRQYFILRRCTLGPTPPLFPGLKMR